MDFIQGLKCRRCLYEWKPHRELPPKHCPRCNSPYWQTERKKKQNG